MLASFASSCITHHCPIPPTDHIRDGFQLANHVFFLNELVNSTLNTFINRGPVKQLTGLLMYNKIKTCSFHASVGSKRWNMDFSYRWPDAISLHGSFRPIFEPSGMRLDKADRADLAFPLSTMPHVGVSIRLSCCHGKRVIISTRQLRAQ